MLLRPSRRIISHVTSHLHVVALTGAIRGELPDCCQDCVFWQTLTGATDARRKATWTRAFEDTHGAWGRVLFEGDVFLGLVQYGPSSAFPRARTLPAGPPDPHGVLLTCSFLADGDPTDTLERLLLDVLADAKARSFDAVDAFAIGPREGVPTHVQIVGHRTLFPRAVLTGLGFQEARARGPVVLMRLALRGLQEERSPARTAEPAPGVAPAPS